MNAVRVAPNVNGPPAFDSASMTRTVDENTTAGGDVGDPVTATDPDEGDEVMYSITGGADMDAFDIDEKTGQIEVGMGTDAGLRDGPEDLRDRGDGHRSVRRQRLHDGDHHGHGRERASGVDARNGPTNTVTPPVTPTITVTGDATVDYEENGTGAVGTYTSSEAGATWSLSGEDMDAFSISSGGVLSFTSPPDFEAQTDANTDNVYMVTVVANAPKAPTTVRWKWP